MEEKDGVVVEKLGMIGSTEHGEHLAVEVKTDRGQEAYILFPYGLFQQLMLGLSAAGIKAYNEQLARLKTDQAIIDFAGIAGIRPTDYRLGRGVDEAGNDILLMRLCINGVPLWDVMMGPEQATEFATAILRQVREGPEKPRPAN